MLESLELKEYIHLFEREGIDDLVTLHKYSEAELRGIGIKGGHAKKILSHLATHNSSVSGGIVVPLSHKIRKHASPGIKPAIVALPGSGNCEQC